MRNKIGAMELGINTIVILVIALVILGLGIVFVTKIINPDKIPPYPKFPFIATADNPIEFNVQSLDVKAGKSSNLEVSVYNKDFGTDQDIKVDLAGCEGVDSGITATSLVQKIPAGSAVGYYVIIKVDKSVSAGQYICSIVAGLEDSSGNVDTQQSFKEKQFLINVFI